MPTLPEPLHPAIIHFPVVLILLGALVAVLAVVIRGRALPWLASALLVAGALGALTATRTGGKQAEMVGELSARAERLLDLHEEWGERTAVLAASAGVLALVGASLGKWRRTAFCVGLATAVVAGVAAYAVTQTGHLGGQLVYKHGVGINAAAGEHGE